LSLQRSGGSVGAVEVFFETQTGNASTADFSAVAGSVSWADGDAGEKIIEIPIVADGAVNEFTETFFVRLYNPRNGLMLAAPSLAVVDIADRPDEPVSSSSSSTASSVTTSSVTTSSVTNSSVISASSSAAVVAPTKSGGGGSVPVIFIGVLGMLIFGKRNFSR